MRSDAAPALSQAIEPEWTAPHIFAYEDDGDISPLTIASDEPSLELFDLDQDSDSARWKWALDSSDFPYMVLRMVDGDGTILGTPIRIDRNGPDIIGMLLRADAGPITIEGNEVALYVNDGDDTALAVSEDGEWDVGGNGIGLAGQVLVSGGPGVAPSWGNVVLSAAEQVYAPPAGTTNDVVLTAQRVLVNTAAGNATLTSFVAQANGTLVLLTNTGVNDLVLAVGTGPTAANQLYGVADITIISHGSKFISYSGTLQKWVLV
jgi:hypothetical protein